MADPTPCPICRQPGGFHDHGEPGSRHDAHQVPRHLILPTKTRRARKEETCSP